jgi:hypothetical protein
LNDPSILTKLDEKLADMLGRSPNGRPLYRWFYSDSWFHIMNLDECRGGRLEERKMVLLDDVWILGHWHEPLTRSQWEAMHGLKLLWSENGLYTPTNITLREGEFPTMDTTDQIIAVIRKHRTKTFDDFYQDGERIIERREKAAEARRSDIIDDACTAFGNDPGTRNGNVSFGGVDVESKVGRTSDQMTPDDLRLMTDSND